MEQIELPTTLKMIGYSAFKNCKNLKSIKLPDSLEHIGKGCFLGSALGSISIPPELKEIEEYTFYQCENLRTVRFSEELEKIGLCAFAGSGLESIELPASLSVVSQAVFAKCKSLKTVKFNEGLEVLGTNEYPPKNKTFKSYYGVFKESSVEHVELPRTLRRIEYSTFEDCKNLKSIRLPEKLEYIG